MGASSREHAMGASSREHAMDASGREHAMGASGREHAMDASSREHAMGASGREHANGREHLFQRLPFAFPRTFYGSLGQCQGFAAPRKNRAPLTPPQPSTKSYREESEGKEQRTGAPGLRTTGCGFTPRPILETLTPAGISLLRAKNGLDKGVHLRVLIARQTVQKVLLHLRGENMTPDVPRSGTEAEGNAVGNQGDQNYDVP